MTDKELIQEGYDNRMIDKDEFNHLMEGIEIINNI